MYSDGYFLFSSVLIEPAAFFFSCMYLGELLIILVMFIRARHTRVGSERLDLFIQLVHLSISLSRLHST